MCQNICAYDGEFSVSGTIFISRLFLLDLAPLSVESVVNLPSVRGREFISAVVDGYIKGKCALNNTELHFRSGAVSVAYIILHVPFVLI